MRDGKEHDIALAKKYMNKNVLFWGCGEMLKMKYHMFKNCICEYIIADIPNKPKKLFNIPVVEPSTVLPFHDNITIIIFAGLKAQEIIKNKIIKYYPNVKKIETCSHFIINI